MNRKAMIRVGVAVTAFVGLAWVATAEEIEGADIPPAGLYWRSPLPDGLGNLNFAIGSTVRLHAALVDLARVDRVVYLAGGSQVAQVTNPPYAFDWTVAGSGTVTLRAEARDGAGTVQGWCERTIQIVGEGLRVPQSAIAVTVATGGSTTVTLDLTNLGPGSTEWALHVQGGTAPGGTNGRIVKTFLPSDNPGGLTYRHRGTPETADDEIWYSAGDYQLRRRGVSDWADLGLFEKTNGDKIGYYCKFDADGDRYWSYHTVSTPSGYVPGFSLIDVASKAELRRIQLDGLPGITGTYSTAAAHPNGVVYCGAKETVAGVNVASMWQARSRDGRLIAAHGILPTWWTAMYSPGPGCWKDGHFWIYGSGSSPHTRVKLWRWTPGMDDIVEVVSWTPSSSTYGGSICPAAEPGFLWVSTSELSGARVQLVDTGYRPWLLPVTSAGTLANGAGQSVTVQIDASTAPTGTYHGVLALTQYPNDLIPQITVPVTLTVTSGGSNQPPTLVSPAWAVPAAVTLPAGTTVQVVANDPDGDPLAYAWSKVSGPGTATFATPTAADSGVTFGAAGSYVLRVAISDGNGGSVTSDVSVTVTSDVDARADCNADGVVNALDLQIVIANFGQTVP